MKIGYKTVMLTSGLFTPIAMMFITDAIKLMIPWLLAVAACISADFIAGIRKSLILGIHVSLSEAARKTMGKTVVYVSFVIMVCMIETATKHSFRAAMLGCLFICAIEVGSVISNILKPYGIDLSLRGIIDIFLKRSPLHATDEETKKLLREESVKKITEIERQKWEKNSKR